MTTGDEEGLTLTSYGQNRPEGHFWGRLGADFRGLGGPGLRLFGWLGPAGRFALSVPGQSVRVVGVVPGRCGGRLVACGEDSLWSRGGVEPACWLALAVGRGSVSGTLLS